jgi:hypothetical protein
MASVRELAGKAFDFLRARRTAYQLTFRDDNYAAQQVLIDLAKFCRAGRTTFHPDPRISAVLQGRHEVWLRITNHLHLTSEQLFALYNGNQFSAATRVLSNEGDDDA